MNRTQLITTITIIICSLATCNYFQKEKEDNSIRNLGILSILNRSNTSTTSSCSGTSGVVICIPVGIAE